MSSIFNRLGFNFDATKFGDALDPAGDLEEKLLDLPSPLLKWQFDAVANSDVSGYFQNPVSNVTITIKSTANSMINVASNASLSNIVSISQNLTGYVINTGDEFDPVYVFIEGECDKFKNHSDRMSGVSPTVDPDLPDFGSALGTGEVMLILTNKYDGVINNTPILGSFTSLFVEPDLSAYQTIFANDVQRVNNSIVLVSDDGMGNVVYGSTLSSSELSGIVNNITAIYNTMSTRRTHDVSFYNNSKLVLDDFVKISQYAKFSPLRLYLVENYIGTDKLKNEL
jgi:hypothetical protein